MAHRTTIIAAVALIVAFALPIYFFVIKKRAAQTLDELLAERFAAARACPVHELVVPSGGRITLQACYEDGKHPELRLVLGSWDRGQVKMPYGATYIHNKVAGVFKSGGDAAWLAGLRDRADVIVAVPVEGGAIVMWSGLPSRDSVVAHFEAAE